MKEGKLLLSQEQLKTYKVISSFIDHSISRQEAAELLGLSARQISRLKKGILDSGASSLIHRNTGRRPSHAFSDKVKKAVLTIHSYPEYEKVNFLHFQEILKDKYDITISYSPLLSILKNAGIQSPLKKKSKNVLTAANKSLMPGS